LGAHIVFVDESGFMLIPTVRRTWAPCGQTPIIRHRYNHARISVIGGLSVSPGGRRLGLYFRPHAGNISRDEVEDFLWHLLRHLRGHVIVVWDGASIHHPKGLQDLLNRYPRLHLEKLPAYAPQLNPIEALWHAAKLPLANGQPDDIPELGRDVVGSLRTLRASQRILRGCIRQSDLAIHLG
jgi:transposase